MMLDIKDPHLLLGKVTHPPRLLLTNQTRRCLLHPLLITSLEDTQKILQNLVKEDHLHQKQKLEPHQVRVEKKWDFSSWGTALANEYLIDYIATLRVITLHFMLIHYIACQ